jgi:hypothetical protein
MRIHSLQQFLVSYCDILGKTRRRSTLIISVFLLFLAVSGCKLLTPGGNRSDTSSRPSDGDRKGGGAGPVSTTDAPLD